jgi:hypothetical protein
MSVRARRKGSNRTRSTHEQNGSGRSLGQPGSQPVVVVPDLEVESNNRHLDVLDLEESLTSLLLGVLEGDVKVDSLGSELNVKQTRVLEGDPTGLLVEPVGNVGGLDVQALDPQTSRAVVVGSVCSDCENVNQSMTIVQSIQDET